MFGIGRASPRHTLCDRMPMPRTSRPYRPARREAILFYLCISPWLLGFTVFILGPVLSSLGLSFTRWDLLSDPVFVGLRNYTRMVDDKLFWQALSVTVRYTLLYVPAELVGGLLLALLMNQKGVRGIRGARTIYYLPTIISGVAFVVVWMWLFQPEAGLINATLARFGIQGPRWLADPNTALTALWLMSLWGLGRAALIYLAGLKGIPQQLYEAAAIDGAGAVAELPPRDAADAHAHHLFQPGAEHHRHLPDLYQRVCRHQRRAARLDALLRALSLPQGVPGVPDGLCLGAGLGALPHHPRADDPGRAQRPVVGLLRRGEARMNAPRWRTFLATALVWGVALLFLIPLSLDDLVVAQAELPDL